MSKNSKNKAKQKTAHNFSAPQSEDSHKHSPPRAPEVPRNRKAEKELADMAGLSLSQFRRICRGTDLQCLACGKIIHSPRRKLCDERCRKIFMERLQKIEESGQC